MDLGKRIGWASLCSLLSAWTLACSDNPEPSAPAPDGGAGGSGGGSCAAGTVLGQDGSCQPAGIPPELCGEGFVPDTAMGCEPVLPAEPCPFGQMAVPGDTECRVVTPCGEAPWGDIAQEPDTQYVDGSYSGGDSDGSAERPWTAIQEGVDAAAPGAIVAVAAGTYVEDVLIETDPVRLQGRCPELVEVVGTAWYAVDITRATGTEISGLSIRSAIGGVYVDTVEDVRLERLWLHDVENAGIFVDGVVAGSTSAIVHRCLVERIGLEAVEVRRGGITLDETVVRDAATLYGGYTIGLESGLGAASRGRVLLRSSLLERNMQLGVAALGADVTIETSVIRETALWDGQDGMAVAVGDDPLTGERSNLTIRGSLLEDNHETGVLVLGSDATIETTVVRRTHPNDAGGFGRGINVQSSTENPQRAMVTVRSSLIEGCHDVGIYVSDSSATLEATAVRGTLPDQPGSFGDGVVLFSPHDAAVADGLLTGSLLEDNARAGVAIFGATLALQAAKFECNIIDLNGESEYLGRAAPFVIDDRGGLGCGCGAESWQCGVQSSQLEPSAPIEEP